MNDEEVLATWTTLEPTVAQRQRIQRQVFAWLDARETSLAAEWLGFFRVSPVSAIGLVTASAASLVMATPFLWLARALF